MRNRTATHGFEYHTTGRGCRKRGRRPQVDAAAARAAQGDEQAVGRAHRRRTAKRHAAATTNPRANQSQAAVADDIHHGSAADRQACARHTAQAGEQHGANCDADGTHCGRIHFHARPARARYRTGAIERQVAEGFGLDQRRVINSYPRAVCTTNAFDGDDAVQTHQSTLCRHLTTCT